jgi:uncharacterized damage-inducible protein DinB
MNESMIFNQLEMVRASTLHFLKKTSEEDADVKPNGYSNNIRWNLGHIYVVQEFLTFNFANEPMKLPENYVDFFAPKTSPTDWKMQPPALEELAKLLSEQTNRLTTTFSGRFDEKATKPFKAGPLEVSTLGELLLFNIYHESEHIGIMKGINKTLQA